MHLTCSCPHPATQLDSALGIIEISLLTASAPGKSAPTQNVNFQEIKKNLKNLIALSHVSDCFFYSGTCKIGNDKPEPGKGVSVPQSWGREKVLPILLRQDLSPCLPPAPEHV